MEKEEQIKLIAGRILDEYHKHKQYEWQDIAARKIHSQWFDYYNQQTQELQRQLDELKEAADKLLPIADQAMFKTIEEINAIETYEHLTNKQ